MPFGQMYSQRRLKVSQNLIYLARSAYYCGLTHQPNAELSKMCCRALVLRPCQQNRLTN